MVCDTASVLWRSDLKVHGGYMTRARSFMASSLLTTLVPQAAAVTAAATATAFAAPPPLLLLLYTRAWVRMI